MEVRFGHALVAANNKLVALGGAGRGHGDNSSSLTVEMLNNLKGKWTWLKPMNTPRNRLAAVAFDGEIYALVENLQEELKVVLRNTTLFQIFGHMLQN